jgi:hypothetical protein
VNIAEIDGIAKADAASLERAGIGTTDALLERGASAAGRAEIAGMTGIDAGKILQWVNHVDLMRIHGVGSEYSDLLEAAGVDSPAELAKRNPANLHAKIQETVDGQPGIVHRVPTEAELTAWIEESKTLPKLVTHGSAGAGAGVGAAGTEASRTMSTPPTPAQRAASVADSSTKEPVSAQAAVTGASTKTAESASTAASQASAAAGQASSAASSTLSSAASQAGSQAGRATAPVSAMSSSATSSHDDGDTATASKGGLWARIKRMFGGS